MRRIPLEVGQVWKPTQNIWGDGPHAGSPLRIEGLSDDLIRYSDPTGTFVAKPKEFRRWIREKAATLDTKESK